MRSTSCRPGRSPSITTSGSACTARRSGCCDQDSGWRLRSGTTAGSSAIRDPAEVVADPDFADLLPYVDLIAEVPRVRPRTRVDLSIGHDISSGGRRVWSLQAQVTNLTNRTAPYNFQWVFVGTRIVQPRTFAVRVKRYF